MKVGVFAGTHEDTRMGVDPRVRDIEDTIEA